MNNNQAADYSAAFYIIMKVQSEPMRYLRLNNLGQRNASTRSSIVRNIIPHWRSSNVDGGQPVNAQIVEQVLKLRRGKDALQRNG